MQNVILKPRKARPFHGRHPWVLDSAIESVEGDPADGQVVDLLTHERRWVARGIYNGNSRIRVRLYTWNANEQLDTAFWRRRLETAVQWRAHQPGKAETAGRLVFSEADQVSGLVVDRYADYLVVEVTALAIAARLEEIVPILVELTQPRGILVRAERLAFKQERMALVEGTVWGQPPGGPVFISEHGIRYGVDLAGGQKTGFFLDQRENRLAAAAYMRDRRVLDMFCYSGGFSLAAAVVGGATEVLGVDSSAKAIALAKANAQLNEVTQVRFEVGSAFETLELLASEGRRFGVVVLDPPKFARSRQAVDQALRAYHQLNQMAVDLLGRDGILVTCSCSGHVSREDFLHILADVAQRSGRAIQVLQQRGAAPDHPVSAACLETDYLKCFICRVV